MSLTLLPLLGLLIQSPDYRFAGGDGGALVRELSLARKAPVALLAEADARYSAFTVTMAEPEDFRRLLNLRTGFATGTKTGLGLAPRAWPEGMYFLDHRPDYLRNAKTLPVKAFFVGGKATLTTAEAPARLSEVVKGRWSKPFRVHWFYREAAVWASAKDAPEADVARTLAEAVGASFREEKDAYVLGFDPRAYRARGIGQLDVALRQRLDPHVRSTFLFTKECLAGLSDSKLLSLFVLPPDQMARKPEEQVPIASPRLQTLARQRLFTQFEIVDGKSANPSLNAVWEQIKGLVDWSKPAWTSLSQSGIMGAVYRGTDRDGKPIHIFV